MGYVSAVVLGMIRLLLFESKTLWLSFFIMIQNFIFQGLCLVDWGRGIDKRLFPENAEFKGDCRTSGFRCVEMQENKPWTFQASLKSYVISNAAASIIDLTY